MPAPVTRKTYSTLNHPEHQDAAEVRVCLDASVRQRLRPMTRPSNWRRTSSKTARTAPSPPLCENFRPWIWVPTTPKSSSPSCTMNFRRHPLSAANGILRCPRITSAGASSAGAATAAAAVLQFPTRRGDKRRDDTWFHKAMVAINQKTGLDLPELPSFRLLQPHCDSGAGEGQNCPASIDGLTVRRSTSRM